MLGAPGLVVGLGGQHAHGPQLVEDRALVEARLQPFGIEPPERGISAVALYQLTAGIEDGNGRSERIDDGAQMRQTLGLRRCGLGRYRPLPQIADAANRQRHLNQIESMRGGEVGDRHRLAPGQRLVGGIGEGHLAAIAEQHSGVRQGRQHRGDIVGAIGRACVGLVQRGAHAHGGAGAQSPAHDPHLAAVAGWQHHIEALPAAAQIVDPTGQQGRVLLVQPGVEIEDRLDAAAVRQHRGGGTQKTRIAGTAAPYHGDLAGARQQRLIVVDHGPQRRHLVGGTALRLATVANDAAHQRQGHQRKGAGAQRDGERHGAGKIGCPQALAQRRGGSQKCQGSRSAKRESQSSPESLRPHAPNSGKLNRNHLPRRGRSLQSPENAGAHRPLPHGIPAAPGCEGAPESSNHSEATSREKESSSLCTAGKSPNMAIDRGPNSERLVNARSSAAGVAA